MKTPVLFCLLFLLPALLISTLTASGKNFVLRVPEDCLKNEGLNLTIADLTGLLSAAKVGFLVNKTANPLDDIVIDLDPLAMLVLDKTIQKDPSKMPVYDLSYSIDLKPDRIVLNVRSIHGLSAALYGLLQDVLGFSFYHPRQTKIPDLSQWQLPAPLTLESKPRFDKMGFHLHTMHPTELAEALLNPEINGAWEMVREYIDWLVRNRQNYFEFNLLNSVDLERWMPHAARLVNYMHLRGVFAGLDLSLNMLQQKAFQLYQTPPFSFEKKEKQLSRNVEVLLQIPWDVWNVEFSATEFSAGNTKKKNELLSLLHRKLLDQDCKLVSRMHVVKKEEMLNDNSRKHLFENEPVFADSLRGIFVHTVMFYGLNDGIAPVYQNKNLFHLRDALKKEMSKRETWYFPESAYWVNFDISIPLFFPTYLSARLSDILYTHSLGIDGHITFSSGWEWGYWLIDWSIANWCWETSLNGNALVPDFTGYFFRLTENEHQTRFLNDCLELNNSFIRDKNLIQYLAVQTVSDELPFEQFRLQFQPRPDWQYRWLSRKSDAGFLQKLLASDIALLDTFIQKYENLAAGFDELRQDSLNQNPFFDEIKTALDVVQLRAKHRRSTLLYLIYRRLEQQSISQTGLPSAAFLDQAQTFRNQAIELVRHMEKKYRYPLEDLCMPKKSKTVYQFGYLFTAHELFFWKREELQAKHNRWGPFYENIWDIPAILGIKK